ncbi:MAG: T9SS type A sorting domain-containing protein [Candidatus Eisenbacteria sp.]|nr:T9SS type A sorting domain-containing protein [Candidatus Eisenbacteria bacterium]
MDELLIKIDNLWWYNNESECGFDWGYFAGVLCGNAFHGGIPDEGEAAQQVAEAMVATLPNTCFRWKYETNYSTAWQRIQASVDLYNQDQELVFITGSESKRSFPGNWLDILSGFEMSMINSIWLPWTIVATCEGIGIFRTEDPYYPITAVAKRMTTTWGHGSIGWIGPGCGSLTKHCNLVIGPRIVENIGEDVTRSMALSTAIGLNQVMAEHLDDPVFVQSLKTWQTEGDPVSPLMHAKIPCHVDDPQSAGHRLFLAQNSPNPGRGCVTINFGLAEQGPARLQLFDTNGRLVRTLVDGKLEAGPHTLVWDGRDNTGQQTSAGVYFYRLYADGRDLRQRMMHLR